MLRREDASGHPKKPRKRISWDRRRPAASDEESLGDRVVDQFRRRSSPDVPCDGFMMGAKEAGESLPHNLCFRPEVRLCRHKERMAGTG
jgi:hypothetical protein